MTEIALQAKLQANQHAIFREHAAGGFGGW